MNCPPESLRRPYRRNTAPTNKRPAAAMTRDQRKGPPPFSAAEPAVAPDRATLLVVPATAHLQAARQLNGVGSALLPPRLPRRRCREKLFNGVIHVYEESIGI